jgi:two-component system sensor histidine kinase AlgZ
LPNFCNLGVMLRVLIVVNILGVATAILRVRDLAEAPQQFLIFAAFTEPVLVISLLTLCASRRLLHSLSYPVAIALLCVFELLLAWGSAEFFGQLVFGESPESFVRIAVLVLFVTGATLFYFDLRSRALSPAIAEARIQALQARIRPHFLFNSINAVLSLIRSEPKRAERALEDLADLFRVLMADNRALAPIAKEVELASQYLAIEKLRLGNRLQVRWNTERMPAEALVPALLLQPLVENAVYHGIEPLEEGGTIAIEVSGASKQVLIVLTNPFRATGSDHHSGNKMALANIRERLALHFDAEASMQSRIADGNYEVTIRLPLITEQR